LSWWPPPLLLSCNYTSMPSRITIGHEISTHIAAAVKRPYGNARSETVTSLTLKLKAMFGAYDGNSPSAQTLIRPVCPPCLAA
jgi:hypothetical protein